jgi:hypothetical protein
MLVIDYKKILETNTKFYEKYYDFDETHHLHDNRMPGEHYKLLTYLSYSFNGITILDIGTNGGESCLALAQNKNNKVITYDIIPPKNLGWKPLNGDKLPYLKDYENIEVKVMDINEEDPSVILNSKFMFFDIAHDGVQEKRFSDMLNKHNYKGYVLCDDVYSKIYPKCSKWFQELNIEKYNISEVGHYSDRHGHGSGLLNYYNDNSVEIVKNI